MDTPLFRIQEQVDLQEAALQRLRQDIEMMKPVIVADIPD